MTPTPEPTTSAVCEMPSCLPVKSESDNNVILAWAMALLLLACILGLKKKGK